jgi:hypothetical protein
MDGLLEFLLKVEERPAMRLGNRYTMESLWYMLGGYINAKRETNSDYGRWFDDIWNEKSFRAFLENKFGDKSNYDWATLIMNNEPGGNSIDTFFRLLHEYLDLGFVQNEKI